MFFAGLIYSICWTLSEWVIGQRWIEVGIQNPSVTNSNLRRADPLLEFSALAYDTIIEMALVNTAFLAIPYLLKLIKSENN